MPYPILQKQSDRWSGTANDERQMANGEWRMANGEWRMANGDGKWLVRSEARSADTIVAVGAAQQTHGSRSLGGKPRSRRHPAGVRPGASRGMTDELGCKAVQDIHPLYDFRATILHLLGLDHQRLTFEHNGVRWRLINVEGHVIREVLA